MRPLEIILILALSTGLLALLAHGSLSQRVAVICTVLAAIVLVAHVAAEKPHWQMIPAYTAVLLLLGAFAAHPAGRIWLALVGLLCVCASVALSWLLPMFRFAPVTGPYPVGTTIVALIDESRAEDAGTTPSGKRELMVQLWYPAAPSRAPFATYRRAAETTRLSTYQAVLRTSSRLDAPVAESADAFPVILFNPAWNGRRTQDTFLTEELASHGFVVAAIDHPFNSEPVAFPDGRLVMAHHVRAMEDFNTSTAAEIERIGNAEVDKETLDARFVLDTLAKWNRQKGSRWYQHLDAEHAGAVGHSLGGAVAIETWATDLRIRAAMNMDGYSFGRQATAARRGVDTQHQDAGPPPLLFLYEENYNPPEVLPDNPSVEQQVDHWDAAHVRSLIEHYGGYWLNLRGALHPNFTDRTISSPVRRLSGSGPIDPRLAHIITRDYAVSFFSQALLGKPAPWLQDASPRYPEISVRLRMPVPGASPP